ncbi:MAG: GTP cyclohydrolase, FolE2/MptA family, partial [Candidatus Zixiibacteriota bacterium]
MNERQQTSAPLADVQSRPDERNIPLTKVGIADLSYPIRVLDRAHCEQQTVARINLSVNLPEDYRGTHLSRFVEALVSHHQKIGVGEIKD